MTAEISTRLPAMSEYDALMRKDAPPHEHSLLEIFEGRQWFVRAGGGSLTARRPRNWNRA
jgi:hypothetical protein